MPVVTNSTDVSTLSIRANIKRAIKIALGALAGFLSGTILKVIVSFYITGVFVNQIFEIF